MQQVFNVNLMANESELILKLLQKKKRKESRN